MEIVYCRRKEGRREGIKQGIAQGIVETGRELGASSGEIIKILQSRLKISLQVAEEYMDRFGKQKV